MNYTKLHYETYNKLNEMIITHAFFHFLKGSNDYTVFFVAAERLLAAKIIVMTSDIVPQVICIEENTTKCL